MSGSMRYESGELVIRNGSRATFTTAGDLVQFLTTEQTYSASLAFPDVPKGELYGAAYDIDYTAGGGGPSQYGYDIINVAGVGARPQEWSNTITLGSVPSGAEVFIGRATLSRTVAPSHGWVNGTISPRVPMGVGIQITGSFTLEQELGFGRGLSIYIADGSAARPGTPGQLVAHIQQSVGPACGGAGVWGTLIAPNQDSIGGENVFPSGGGILVYQNPSAPYTNSISGTTFAADYYAPGGLLDIVASMLRGGSSAAVYSDPTNYASTYSLTVQGRFGIVS